MTYKTATDLVNEAKARIKEVTPQDVRDMQARGDNIVYLDVREPQEWNLGRLPRAIHIPRGTLESAIEARVQRDQRVVVYCASGNRSAFAADTLQQMGYTKVRSMSGGIKGWVDQGGAVE
jgi:rhodanese-related sulfurtransferase